MKGKVEKKGGDSGGREREGNSNRGGREKEGSESERVEREREA